MNFINVDISAKDKLEIKKIQDKLSLLNNEINDEQRNQKITDEILNIIQSLLALPNVNDNVKKLNFMHNLMVSCLIQNKAELVEQQKEITLLEKQQKDDEQARNQFIKICRQYYDKMRDNTNLYGDLVNNSIEFLNHDLDLLNNLQCQHKIVGEINRIIQDKMQQFKVLDISEEEKKVLDFIEKQGGFIYRIGAKSDNLFMNQIMIHMEVQTANILHDEKVVKKRIIQRDANNQLQVKEYMNNKRIIEKQMKNFY